MISKSVNITIGQLKILQTHLFEPWLKSLHLISNFCFAEIFFFNRFTIIPSYSYTHKFNQQFESNTFNSFCIVHTSSLPLYCAISSKENAGRYNEDSLKSTCLQFFIIRCFVKTYFSVNISRERFAVEISKKKKTL